MDARNEIMIVYVLGFESNNYLYVQTKIFSIRAKINRG